MSFRFNFCSRRWTFSTRCFSSGGRLSSTSSHASARSSSSSGACCGFAPSCSAAAPPPAGPFSPASTAASENAASADLSLNCKVSTSMPHIIVKAYSQALRYSLKSPLTKGTDVKENSFWDALLVVHPSAVVHRMPASTTCTANTLSMTPMVCACATLNRNVPHVAPKPSTMSDVSLPKKCSISCCILLLLLSLGLRTPNGAN